MYPGKGEKIISMLRWPSMVLVALFLGVFLYKSFTAEKQRIEKEKKAREKNKNNEDDSNEDNED